MKKTAYLTLSLALTAPAIYALPNPIIVQQSNANAAAEKARENTDKINSIAQLSQEQYAQVLQINRSFFAQEQGTGGMGGGKSNRIAIQREQKLKAVLTPEQFERVKASE